MNIRTPINVLATAMIQNQNNHKHGFMIEYTEGLETH